MQEEIFAPILPIVEFDNFDNIIKKIQQGDKCLSMYYCGDYTSPNYLKLKNETSSGSLVANDFIVSYISFGTGFGGVGYSG